MNNNLINGYLVIPLKKSNNPYAFYQYPNTGHWFCEPDRVDAYNAEAATLAWERTLEFLRQP